MTKSEELIKQIEDWTKNPECIKKQKAECLVAELKPLLKMLDVITALKEDPKPTRRYVEKIVETRWRNGVQVVGDGDTLLVSGGACYHEGKCYQQREFLAVSPDGSRESWFGCPAMWCSDNDGFFSYRAEDEDVTTPCQIKAVRIGRWEEV